MLSFILTAALIGIFAGTVVWFFKNSMKFYDYVVERMPGWFKALKVLIKKGVSVVYGTLTKDSNGVTKLHTEPNAETVNFEDLDPSIQTAFNKSQYMSNGTKIVEQIVDADAERELRRA